MFEQIVSITSIIVGISLLGLSFVGCILPILPGPVLAYAALLLLYLTQSPPSTAATVLGGVAVAVALVLDYIVPSIGAKMFKSSKLGIAGCLLGSLWGLVVGTVLGFFLPFLAAGFVAVAALLVGPFCGTLVGELLSNKEIKPAFSGAIGSFVGFLVSIVLKGSICGFIAILFAWTLLMH
jgi:hypothetical protein